MKPVPQLRGPPAGSPASLITTKPGRFWFCDPRPYSAQEPRLGRPARIEPVFIWQTEPTWFSPSAQHDRSTAMSSTHSATFGSQSLTHRPDLPCCLNARLLASSLLPPTPIAVM